MISARSLKSKCPKGCCELKTRPYIPTHKRYFFTNRKKEFKGGVFFYDPKLQKTLIIQSRGEKWGPPKGKKEEHETIEECAIREVKEETGLEITIDNLSDNYKYIVDKATYYYVEMNSTDTPPIDSISSVYDNDATGIAWISVNCLIEMIQLNTIDVNSHCKKLLQKILKLKI